MSYPTLLPPPNTMTTNNQYNTHYKEMPVEPIALMKTLLTKEELQGFYKGNIIKYALRAGHKPGESVDKDLTKLRAYEELLRATLYSV